MLLYKGTVTNIPFLFILFVFSINHSQCGEICALCNCTTTLKNNTIISKLESVQANEVSVLKINCTNVLSAFSEMTQIDQQNYSTASNFSDSELQKYRELLGNDTIIQISLENNNITSVFQYMFKSVKNSTPLTGLHKVQYLDLSNNLLKTCDLNAFVLPNIQILDLRNNEINLIVKSNVSIDSLKETDFSHNSITELYDFGDSLPNLENLNLSHNKIFTISNSFFVPLTKLKHLDLSYNNLIYFDLTNSTLTEIISINLQHNILKTITIFETHKYLKALTLNYNKLSALPFIPKKNIIETLHLSHNLLKNCAGINNLMLCKILDLSWNEISTCNEIPVSATKLNLSGNQLNQIPQISNAQKPMSLHLLDLSDMHTLVKIGPNSFQDFFPENEDKKCPVLDLSNCSISEIHKEAFVGTKLCKIKLNRNKINVLPKLLLDWENVEIDIQENPLNCECSSQWILDIVVPNLYKLNPSLINNLRCSEPDIYRGMRLARWYNHGIEKAFCDTTQLLKQSNGRKNWSKVIILTTNTEMIVTLSLLGVLLLILVFIAFALQRRYIMTKRTRMNRRL